MLETISENQPPPAPHYSRRTVFVFVDGFDLATLAALRYARSMRPTTIRAVHFVIDNVRADKLRGKWTRADRGVTLDFIDCSDRRLTRAAAELVEREASDPERHVTVVLPRRSYSALLGRLLHDRTADKIAAVVSRIPRSAATIIPYDVESRVRVIQERHAAKIAAAPAPADRRVTPKETEVAASHGSAVGPQAMQPPDTAAPAPQSAPKARGVVKGRVPGETNGRRSAPAGRAADGPAGAAGAGAAGARAPGAGAPAAGAPAAGAPGAGAPGITPIGSLTQPGRATVEGRIRVVEIKPVERNSVLACEISDGTGELTAMFYGRSHIPGIVCSARVRFKGSVGIRADGHPVMTNPAYELLFPAV